MPILRTRTYKELQEMTDRYAKTQVELQETQGQKAALAVQNESLDAGLKKLREVQELIVDDILALKTFQEKYVGNDYRSYDIAVKAIAEKYSGQAAWGCFQTGTIIDLRAAFILGEGIKVVHKTKTKEEATAELEWAKAFFKYNGLDSEMAQEMAKEAEIEGKVCIRLFWDKDPYGDYPGMVSARFVSWLDKQYKVVADPEDYLWYKRLTWEAKGDLGKGDVPEEEFVYKKFGGRMSKPNEAQPKVMKCLTLIDRLDRALRDLREIDHLFSSPTPDFECATATEAANVLTYLHGKNWRLGKIIAHVGKFSLKGPDVQGVEILIREIELTTKMISGTTSVPIHYLGLLDLLKNRATGDNTRELVMAGTTRERQIWAGAFEELVSKAMEFYNTSALAQKTEGRLDPRKVGVEIPLISQDHWDNLEKVLIPAALGQIVSKEWVASQIPGVDMDEEAKRREEAEKKAQADAEMEYARIKALNGNGGAGPGQPPPQLKGRPS